MPDDDDADDSLLGLSRQDWLRGALWLILLALLLVGGCRSGWLAPAQLPVPPP